MAKVTRSATRSTYIRSEYPYQGSMTVWALRDFVRALDAEGIPDDATLSAEKHHNTLHFIGLNVRVTTEINESDKAPVDDPPTEPTDAT